jgi:hypothetical protein
MADFENQDGESQPLSIRDALRAAADEHRESGAAGEQGSVTPAAVPAETEAQAAQRVRDEAGRFTKNEIQAPAQTVKPPIPGTAPNAVTSPAPEGFAALSPPSSWKKDHHEAFNKLDQNLQRYILQRETEYNTGVSTYRAEAEKARALNGALEPFLPNMQRYNVNPADWIGTVGRVHEALLQGSPQQKLQTIAGLARDYGIDLSPLLGQAQPQGEGAAAQQSGQLNPEVAWLRDQVQQLSGQLNSFTQTQQQREQAAQRQQQEAIQSEIQQFAADAEKHPHFQALWQPMAQLLESGLAQDLQSAYDKALRMNDELWQASQAQQQQQTEAERQRTAAAAASIARGKTFSVKTATPSSGAVAASTNKDRRDLLREAMSSHAGGRV